MRSSKRRTHFVAIFYPFSQFCEIDKFPSEPANTAKHRHRYISEGVEYGKFAHRDRQTDRDADTDKQSELPTNLPTDSQADTVTSSMRTFWLNSPEAYSQESP